MSDRDTVWLCLPPLSLTHFGDKPATTAAEPSNQRPIMLLLDFGAKELRVYPLRIRGCFPGRSVHQPSEAAFRWNGQKQHYNKVPFPTRSYLCSHRTKPVSTSACSYPTHFTICSVYNFWKSSTGLVCADVHIIDVSTAKVHVAWNDLLSSTKAHGKQDRKIISRYKMAFMV